MSSIEVFLGPAPEVETPPEPTTLLGQHIRHLSASSLGMLNRCHEQFRQRYILGNKEKPGEAMVVGSVMHETLAWNYLTKLESHQDQPLSDAVQYLNDVAIHQVIESEGGVDNIRWDNDIDVARSDAERITTAYYRTVVPRIQPIEVEQRFEMAIPGVEVPIIGYIDTKEQDRIIDTKTGKQAPRKVKPAWQLQGKLYAAAAGMPVEFHAISRAKVPNIVTGLESEAMIVPAPTEGQMGAIANNVRYASMLIEWLLEKYGPDNEWPTTGSQPDFSRSIYPCSFCGFIDGCSAWAGADRPT